MKYAVTKQFTAGVLNGLTVTDTFSPVPFETGREYSEIITGSRYLVTDCRPIRPFDLRNATERFEAACLEAIINREITNSLRREFDRLSRKLVAIRRSEHIVRIATAYNCAVNSAWIESIEN